MWVIEKGKCKGHARLETPYLSARTWLLYCLALKQSGLLKFSGSFRWIPFSETSLRSIIKWRCRSIRAPSRFPKHHAVRWFRRRTATRGRGRASYYSHRMRDNGDSGIERGSPAGIYMLWRMIMADGSWGPAALRNPLLRFSFPHPFTFVTSSSSFSLSVLPMAAGHCNCLFSLRATSSFSSSPNTNASPPSLLVFSGFLLLSRLISLLLFY